MTRILTFLALTIFLVPIANAQEFTKEQTTQIEKMFEKYLLENGETIIQSVEKYQDKQDAETRKKAEENAKPFLEALNKQTNLPMAGNKEGDITLIEFFDYNCGYCRRALEELVTVLDKDKNVKVIFFDMPILGPSSLEASKWSLAAHKQGKYFEYHQALLNHEGQKDEATFEKLAKDLGLNVKQLKKDKDDKEINKILKNNVEQANSLGIRGTPGFIINGKIFPGFMPASRILEILKAERKG